MNIAEGLAREIMRVTVLRCHYERVGRHPMTIVGPQITMMNNALEAACVAAGSNDVVAVIRAHANLKEFEE